MGKRGPPKGTRPGGRKAGTPNKVSGDVRAMALKALEAKNGVAWFQRQMDEQPAAMVAFFKGLLPKDVTVSGGGTPVVLQIISGMDSALGEPGQPVKPQPSE